MAGKTKARTETKTERWGGRLTAPPPPPRPPKTFGYARVSTPDQELRLQVDALVAACVAREDIFADQGSGATAQRPGLDALLAELRPGDVVVTWRLDRLGRSVLNLAELMERLRSQDVMVRSLTDGIDTGTSMGRLLYGLMSSLAEFERETIRERVTAGMAAAKRAGIHVGRRPSLTAEQTEEARRMLAEGKMAKQVARLLKTSESSLYRALRRHSTGSASINSSS